MYFPLSMFDYRWAVRFILLHFGVSRTLLQAPNYRFNQLLKLHIARGDLLRIPEKKNLLGVPQFWYFQIAFFSDPLSIQSRTWWNRAEGERGGRGQGQLHPKLSQMIAISHISPAKQPSNHWILQLLSFLAVGLIPWWVAPFFRCVCAQFMSL